MTHTYRRKEDRRRHPLVFPVGTSVGIRVNGQVVEGRIHSLDGGGWIYVTWNRNGIAEYLRATQVFPLDPSVKPIPHLHVDQ